MDETKVAQTTEVAESIEKPSNGGEAVIVGSQALQNFEAYQHSLTKRQAFKEEWKPIAWCMYSFFVCILFGFDGLAGGIVVSIAKFREDFGELFEGAYVVDAGWQLGWTGATLAGMIIGGFLASGGVNYLGRRITLGISYIVSIGGICFQYYCSTPAQFFGSKLLTGLPMGVFLSVAPSYASEMAPLVIRGAITAGMNFAIVLGQLLGYGVMRQCSFYPDARQYKVLFATQWGFAAFAFLCLPFFPE